MKKFYYVLFTVFILSACSSHYATNGENSYLHSKNGAKLEVPAPLVNTNISFFYDLPAQNQDARISIVPPMVAITA